MSTFRPTEKVEVSACIGPGSSRESASRNRVRPAIDTALAFLLSIELDQCASRGAANDRRIETADELPLATIAERGANPHVVHRRVERGGRWSSAQFPAVTAKEKEVTEPIRPSSSAESRTRGIRQGVRNRRRSGRSACRKRAIDGRRRRCYASRFSSVDPRPVIVTAVDADIGYIGSDHTFVTPDCAASVLAARGVRDRNLILVVESFLGCKLEWAVLADDQGIAKIVLNLKATVVQRKVDLARRRRRTACEAHNLAADAEGDRCAIDHNARDVCARSTGSGTRLNRAGLRRASGLSEDRCSVCGPGRHLRLESEGPVGGCEVVATVVLQDQTRAD